MIQYDSNQFNFHIYDREGDIKHYGSALMKPLQIKDNSKSKKYYIWMTSDPYLQGAASGHGLVCIQSGAQLFAKEFGNSLFNSRDSGGTADYLNCIDILFFQLWRQGRKILVES